MRLGPIWVVGLLVFQVFSTVCESKTLTFFTPESIAKRVIQDELFHPDEHPRGQKFLEDLRAVGENVTCAARLWQTVNQYPGKVFHGAVIGAFLFEMEVLPDNVPEALRNSGIFSDGFPRLVKGLGSFTSSRGDADPWELIPGPIGLTIGLDVESHLVNLTMTSSKGAFGENTLEFSDLAAQTGRAGLKAIELVPHYFSKPLVKGIGKAASLMGEGNFIRRHPKTGLFGVVPATFSGGLVRPTPFIGYGDRGFGTGIAYLADEDVPFEQRRAFRIGARLVKRGLGQRIFDDRTGFLNQVVAMVKGATHWKHLSNDFTYWNEQGDIEIEIYVEMNDPRNPQRTRIEDPRWTWPEQIVVARGKILQARGDLAPKLKEAAQRMNFNPGFSMNLPLGDMGVGRAVGDLRQKLEDERVSGAYWVSEALRGAPGVMPSGGVHMREIENRLAGIRAFHAAYALMPVPQKQSEAPLRRPRNDFGF